MSSAAQRRRKAKRKKAQQDQVLSPEDLPRAMRLVAQDYDRLLDYVGKSSDPSSAAALAQENLESAVNQILELASGYDAFDVLELIRMKNAVADPETYRETEHEGSTAVIELTALILATRGNRQGSLPDINGDRADANVIVDRLQAAAQECIEAGTMLGLFRSATVLDKLSRISFTSVLREVSLRNTAYPHMVEETLDALFNDPAIEQDCRRAMGATASEIRMVLDAAQRLHEAAWRERFKPIGALAQTWKSGPAVSDDILRRKFVPAWTEACANPGDASRLEVSALAAESGLEADLVIQVLDLFTADLSNKTPIDAVSDFFRGDSPLRTRPILGDVSGGRVIVHDGLLVPAIRDRVEEALKQAGLADRYMKRRGEYVESAALALLTANLPGATAYRGFEYFVPDPDAPVPQTRPATYTKLVEGDGLLLIDDVAIIVEAKSGGLTPLSRTGHTPRLRGDLGKIVTGAADQAARLRERIIQDHGLRLRDGSWLDLDAIREVHAIAVSLEDLSGLVTVTADLVHAGLLTGPHLPWTVSLHDLRIISELIARPAELVLYLRRRTEPDVTRRFHAIDELDLFLHMYHKGLYVEPDPQVVARELPQLPPPSVANRRRYAKQQTEVLLSRTDEIDAWYFHQLGIRETPAAKPSLNANPALLQLVDELAAQQMPGWLSTGATLLEGSAQMQREWSREGPALAKKSAQDGQPHSYTVMGGNRADSSFVLAWASQARGQPTERAISNLRSYIVAKKHQMQLVRAAAMLFDIEGRFVTMVFDNRRPGPDPALDAAVSRQGLKTADQMVHRPPPERKPKPKAKPKRRKR